MEEYFQSSVSGDPTKQALNMRHAADLLLNTPAKASGSWLQCCAFAYTTEMNDINGAFTFKNQCKQTHVLYDVLLFQILVTTSKK